VAFPQQISIFYAGKIAPQLGAFIQLTYDNQAGTIVSITPISAMPTTLCCRRSKA